MTFSDQSQQVMSEECVVNSATSPTQTYVYQYGLLSPTVNSEEVFKQLYEAHRLYNNLIALQQQTYTQITALEKEQGDVEENNKRIEALQQALNTLRAEIQTLKGHRPSDAEKQTHKDQVGALQAKAKSIVTDMKTLRSLNKEIRKARKDPLYDEKRRTIHDAENAAWKALYGQHTVFWGTANAVKASADQAKKTAQRGAHFRRWEGEGQLTVQVMSTPSAEDLLTGDCTYCQIDPVDPKAWDPTVPKGERRRLQRTKIRLRVGSQGRDPVWAEWPMIMHRPFPPGAIVTGVSVNRKRHATKYDWTAQVCLKVPAPQLKAPGQKAVSFDTGWRKVSDSEVRVAYWTDTEGYSGEIRTPVSVNERLEKAASLRQIRDLHLDTIRATLVTGLSDRSFLTDDAREFVKAVHMWRSPQKFIRLLRNFGHELPKELLTDLTAWYHRDRHLWQYEVGTLKAAVRCRKDFYRKVAAHFASTYDLIVMEKLNLAGMSKTPKPENKVEVSDDIAKMRNGAARQRHRAAPGDFLTALKNASTKRGTCVVEVPAAYTTRTCANCGSTTKWEVSHELTHTCNDCGTTFDRDFNAAKNILARGLVIAKDPGSLASANPLKTQRKAKWAKRHKTSETSSEETRSQNTLQVVETYGTLSG